MFVCEREKNENEMKKMKSTHRKIKKRSMKLDKKLPVSKSFFPTICTRALQWCQNTGDGTMELSLLSKVTKSLGSLH